MKEKILYSLAFGTTYLFALLPLGMLYLLSDTAYVILYHLLRYRRHTVRENLVNSFPEKEEQELLRIEKAYYLHLCDCVVETVKLLHISDEELKRRVEVVNTELIDKITGEGRPVILYVGHYGNWEWLPVITFYYAPLPFSGQIYRPIKNKVLDRLMLRIRSRFLPVCIPQKQVFRTLMRLHSNGEQFMVAFIADQRPNSRNLNHWTQFLNQKTAYAPGGDDIGKRVNANYVYLEAERCARGHYRIRYKPIVPSSREEEYPYMLGFMKMLEQTIRREPAYWLWSHRRWLHPKYD